jgi:RNA polymerase sigma-70 factor (ECF subfamily)
MTHPRTEAPPSSDQELMRILAFEEGISPLRRAACNELVERWYQPLVQDARFLLRAGAFRLRHLAVEDLVQEAFVTILERARQFDPARPFRPWLRRVLRNLAVSHWRHERRRQTLGAPEELRGRELPPPERLAFEESLEGLSPVERELFRAYYEEGEPVKAIAGRTGQSPGQVYKVLRDLRQRVQMR